MSYWLMGSQPVTDIKEKFKTAVRLFLKTNGTNDERKEAAFAYLTEYRNLKKRVEGRGKKFHLVDFIPSISSLGGDDKDDYDSLMEDDQFKEYIKEFKKEHPGFNHRGGRRTRKQMRKQTRRRRGRGRKGTRRG